MLFILFINMIMLLVLLGSAIFMLSAFIYDIIYYDGKLKLILDLVFAFIFALAVYILGKNIFNLLI